jgi:uncharacterized protein (TIGR03435 family)
VVSKWRLRKSVSAAALMEETGYGVSDDGISGGPESVSYDLFDVIGKVPDDTTPAKATLMLESLLSERFGLVVRRDTRPVPR